MVFKPSDFASFSFIVVKTNDDQLKTGVTPGYVRLSVGIEHIEDILDDLDQAIEKSSEIKNVA